MADHEVTLEAIAVPTVTQQAKTVADVVFETKRWPYLIAFPAMFGIALWSILKKLIYGALGMKPKINFFLLDGVCPTVRGIVHQGGTWVALDLLYNKKSQSTTGRWTWLDRFWTDILNAQAVRNRLKVVKRELCYAIKSFSNEKEVRIISLAAGSAQGVIELMAEMKSQGLIVKAVLVDIDQTALDYAGRLADLHGVRDQITPMKTSASQVARISQNFHPHIVEMVGLLDYLSDSKAGKIFSLVAQSLGDGGVFLTANVVTNIERFFIHWAYNWPSMKYRTAQELHSLAVENGFRNCQVVIEPIGIHALAIARKGEGGA